jgi:hypothetical protein
VVRQALLSRTLDRSWSRGFCVVATTVTRPYSHRLLIVGLHEKCGLRQHCHSTKQLCQRIQRDSYHTWSDGTRLSLVPTLCWSCVHAHGGHFEHLMLCVWQVNPLSVTHFAFLICWNIIPLNFLSSVNFCRSISGPTLIGLFWLILTSWSFLIIYNTQFTNTLYNILNPSVISSFLGPNTFLSTMQMLYPACSLFLILLQNTPSLKVKGIKEGWTEWSKTGRPSCLCWLR